MQKESTIQKRAERNNIAVLVLCVLLVFFLLVPISELAASHKTARRARPQGPPFCRERERERDREREREIERERERERRGERERERESE